MPRLTQKLPSYRKHKASGQAVVTLGGVDHFLGRHGTKTSRVLSDRLVAEWLAAGRRPATQESPSLTVVELSARIDEAISRSYSDGSPSGRGRSCDFNRAWDVLGRARRVPGRAHPGLVDCDSRTCGDVPDRVNGGDRLAYARRNDW